MPTKRRFSYKRIPSTAAKSTQLAKLAPIIPKNGTVTTLKPILIMAPSTNSGVLSIMTRLQKALCYVLTRAHVQLLLLSLAKVCQVEIKWPELAWKIMPYKRPVTTNSCFAIWRQKRIKTSSRWSNGTPVGNTVSVTVTRSNKSPSCSITPSRILPLYSFSTSWQNRNITPSRWIGNSFNRPFNANTMSGTSIDRRVKACCIAL